MGQYVEGPKRAFQTGGAIAQWARVKLVGGLLAACGAADGPGVELGVIETQAFAAGEYHAVRLVTAQGTCKMIAAGAITLGAEVYGDANGEVGTTNTNPLRGTALCAASGAGSIIEVLRANT